MFTGMLAAELRVKNAVIPDSRRQVNTKGYGFFLVMLKTIKGLTAKAIINIALSKTATRWLYSDNVVNPVVAIVLATKPKIPIGAKRITIRTMLEIASLKSCTVFFVCSFACFSEKPRPKPQASKAIKLPLAIALIGFSTTLNAKVDNTSLKPCGGLALALAISKVKDTGKIKLKTTATNAAQNVPNIYKKIITI